MVGGEKNLIHNVIAFILKYSREKLNVFKGFTFISLSAQDMYFLNVGSSVCPSGNPQV